MTKQNVEIVMRGYEAWNRDEWTPELFHPEIEWRTSGLFPGFKPVYGGVAGVREFWDTMKDAWEPLTIHVERVFAQGNKVVTAVELDARGRESGVPVSLMFAHVWEVRDGLVASYTSYPSLAEALRAAGLCEQNAYVER